MPRYIAFLRAINVGGHTVKMDRLRQLFEGLGLENVETFIASGNVIFETAARGARGLEPRLEQHLEAALGYAVAVFLRTPAEVAAAVDEHPFDALAVASARGLYVGFLRQALAAEARQKLDALSTDRDQFGLRGREVYWLAREGLGQSAVSGAALEKALGQPTTLRNVTTLRKLAAKYAAQ
jgi:uncharacterized protein (DUF1697 family)